MQMKDAISYTKSSFSVMPLFLKFIVFICLIGMLLLIIIPVLPFTVFILDEIKVTQSEFWKTGAGPMTFAAGLVLLISGIGIMLRKSWSRGVFCIFIFLVGKFSFSASAFPPFIEYDRNSWLQSMPYVASVILVCALYLYGKRSVRLYFIDNRSLLIKQKI